MEPRVRALRKLRDRLTVALEKDPKNEELLALRRRVGMRLVDAEAGGVRNPHTIAGQVVRDPTIGAP